MPIARQASAIFSASGRKCWSGCLYSPFACPKVCFVMYWLMIWRSCFWLGGLMVTLRSSTHHHHCHPNDQTGPQTNGVPHMFRPSRTDLGNERRELTLIFLLHHERESVESMTFSWRAAAILLQAGLAAHLCTLHHQEIKNCVSQRVLGCPERMPCAHAAGGQVDGAGSRKAFITQP